MLDLPANQNNRKLLERHYYEVLCIIIKKNMGYKM